MSGDPNAAIRRVTDAIRDRDPVDALSTVSGADLSTFLLEVMRRRAEALTPAAVVRRARSDRHVEPGAVDARALHRIIGSMVESLPPAFELVELAPVVPLGTHSAIATVHQHKVVTTVRGTEVAADPTNALAIIAALRRRDGDGGVLRLGAVQRVLRAQPFGGIGQQHFTLLALVTAGRDRGNRDFERTALTDQLRALVNAVRTATPAAVRVAISNLRGPDTDPLIDEVRQVLPHAMVTDDAARASGRGYYRDLCFKLFVATDAGEVEIGDGGFTDWTRSLTGNRKERLLVSGLGLDRLARPTAP